MKKIKLNTLKNMAYIIAKTKLEYGQKYFCIINGEKVEVIN